MPKITRFGGHSIAGVTDTVTTEQDSGFIDDTAAIEAEAAERGLVAGGDPDDAGSGEPAAVPPFDPGTLSVTDVLDLLDDCSEDEVAAVKAAEREGKNRKGITGE